MHTQPIHSQTLIKTERNLERGTPLTRSMFSFHIWLSCSSNLNSIHHPLLVNDLQFESQFPLPVPGEPEPLGGPHPLGLNSEGGEEVQAPTHPRRVQPAGASQRKCLVKESEK